MFDILIRGGLIVDGTGKPGRIGDVGIVGDRICAIGDLSHQSAKQEIQAEGKVITPGFIDPHSHSDLSVLFQPSMTNYLMQGVTTVVGGNCGHSYGRWVRSCTAVRLLILRWLFRQNLPILQ